MRKSSNFLHVVPDFLISTLITQYEFILTVQLKFYSLPAYLFSILVFICSSLILEYMNLYHILLLFRYLLLFLQGFGSFPHGFDFLVLVSLWTFIYCFFSSIVFLFSMLFLQFFCYSVHFLFPTILLCFLSLLSIFSFPKLRFLNYEFSHFY